MKSFIRSLILCLPILFASLAHAQSEDGDSAPAKRTPKVGDVQPSEEYTIRRRVLSLNTTYLGFGVGAFENENVHKTTYDFALGYNWEVTSHAAIRIQAEDAFAGDFKTNFAIATLGLNYFFTDEATAPYVGGGLGYGLSASSDSSATSVGGFAGVASAGLMLFRTSSTHFDFNVSYSAVFANNTIGTPGLFAFRIGVLY